MTRRRVHHQPCRFIHNDDMFILKKDIERAIFPGPNNLRQALCTNGQLLAHAYFVLRSPGFTIDGEAAIENPLLQFRPGVVRE